jgi:hypothetical protein
MECKCRWVNLRKISDLRRAFWPALEVTGISDDLYRRTIEMSVISVRPPLSTMNNIQSIREHLGALAPSLGGPGRTCDKLGSTCDKSESIANHSRAVWEIRHPLWECCWCTRQSLLLLIIQSFTKLLYSVCLLIYASMNLWIYIANNLNKVYRDWLQAVPETNSRCAWR